MKMEVKYYWFRNPIASFKKWNRQRLAERFCRFNGHEWLAGEVMVGKVKARGAVCLSCGEARHAMKVKK